MLERCMHVTLAFGLLAVGCDEPPKPQKPKVEAKSEEKKAEPAAESKPEVKADPPAAAAGDDPKEDPGASAKPPSWTMACTANGSPLKLTAEFDPGSDVERIALDDGKGHSMSWSGSAGLVMFADVEEQVLAFKSGPGATGRAYLDFYALPKSMKVTDAKAKFDARVAVSGFDGADAIGDLELACTAGPREEGEGEG